MFNQPLICLLEGETNPLVKATVPALGILLEGESSAQSQTVCRAINTPTQPLSQLLKVRYEKGGIETKGTSVRPLPSMKAPKWLDPTKKSSGSLRGRENDEVEKAEH